MDNVIQIKSLPGIKRDGTKFEGDQYTGGVWCRFQRGLPRKIGGYRSINKYLREKSTALSEYTLNDLTYIHSGSANYVERFYIDNSNNTSVITDRTPDSDFVPDPNNMWQFAFDGIGPDNQILAQVAPNLADITNDQGGALYYGGLFDTAPLVLVTPPTDFSATGGVVALHPYTFVYGSNGYVAWSVAGDPTDFSSMGSGAAYIASQKIVKGLPLRGGPGNSPSGLFWATDALLRVSFVGGDTVFQFDTLSTQTSIMSTNSVIEYDGIFYWLGVDRFLMFNGVVREIPNDMNSNFLFDSLNYAQRQKVFVTKVPRYGEIWWSFPLGDATECNWAIIYNVRENTWYDTPLPNGGRSAGIFPTVFRRPLMTGVEPQEAMLFGVTVGTAGTGYGVGNILTLTGGIFGIAAEITVLTIDGSGGILTTSISNAGEYSVAPVGSLTWTGGAGTGAVLTGTFVNPYKLWVHEIGVDEIDGQTSQPILSYFETADISMPVLAQVSQALQVTMIEPDFVQSGDMTMQLLGRANARSPEVAGDIKTIPETPSVPGEQVVYELGERREMRFRFSSNVIGGDYQMGLILAHVQPADSTVIG